MSEYIIFNPVSVLFYCFGIILPTIMILINLGHIVFTIGEYKESDKTMPVIMLLLILKMFITAFSLFSIYHFLFVNEINKLSLSTSICFIWGILITVDSYISNKLLKIIDSYTSGEKLFKDVVGKAFYKIYKHSNIAYFIRIISIFILIVLSILSFFIYTHSIINILDILLIIYVWVLLKISDYIKIHQKKNG